MARTAELHKKPLVFGIVGGRPIVVNYTTAASITFKNNSGKYVTPTSDQGYVTLAVTASANLCGWAMCGAISTNASVDVTRIDIDIALNSLYEMPIDAAQTPAALMDLMWESCDIVCAGITSVQYADLNGSTYDVLQLVDYRAYVASSSAENTVITRMSCAVGMQAAPAATTGCKGGVA